MDKEKKHEAAKAFRNLTTIYKSLGDDGKLTKSELEIFKISLDQFKEILIKFKIIERLF